MDPLSQCWVVLAAISPLPLILCSWSSTVISRAAGQPVDLYFVKAILGETVAGGMVSLAAAVIFFLPPSASSTHSSVFFLCAAVTVRTLHVSTAASATVDLVLRRECRAYHQTVGVNHVRYHLMVLLVASLLVGLSTFYACKQSDQVSSIYVPVNVETSYRIFLVSLYSLLAAIATVMATSVAFAKCCDVKREKSSSSKSSTRTCATPVVITTIICNHGPYLVIQWAWLTGRWTPVTWLEWASATAMISQGLLLPAILWMVRQTPVKSTPRTEHAGGMLFVRADTNRKSASVTAIDSMDTSSTYSTMAAIDTDPIYATLTLSVKGKGAQDHDDQDDGASVTTSANDDFEYHRPKRTGASCTTINRQTSMSVNDINLAGMSSRNSVEEIVYVLNGRSESSISLYQVNLSQGQWPKDSSLRRQKRIFVSDYI